MSDHALVFAAVAISLAWLALLGISYLIRFKMRAALPVALAAIGVCYLALALCALLILGFDNRGALGAAGMLVPAAVASALASFRR